MYASTDGKEEERRGNMRIREQVRDIEIDRKTARERETTIYIAI